MTKSFGMIALDENRQPIVDAYGDVIVFQDKEHMSEELKCGYTEAKRLVRSKRKRKKKETK